jgi:isopentenyl-diphosphate delta-isomerase
VKAFFFPVTFPNLWTNTCCSHPLATPEESVGEKGVKIAARRRVWNELGIEPEDCPTEEMIYLTRILYASPSSGQWGEHELDYILFLKRDVALNPNPNEVKNVTFVGQKDFPDFLKTVTSQGEGITPWFDLIAKHFLMEWWQNLDSLDQFVDHENIKCFV